MKTKIIRLAKLSRGYQYTKKPNGSDAPNGHERRGPAPTGRMPDLRAVKTVGSGYRTHSVLCSDLRNTIVEFRTIPWIIPSVSKAEDAVDPRHHG